MSAPAASLERPAVGGRRAGVLSGAGLLSGAMVGSGLLVYCFHILAARSLGAESYGGIAVLWAALFLSVIVVFRPLEQTVSRSMAARRAGHVESGSVVRSTAAVAGAAICLAALGGAAAWPLIRDGLFAGDGLLTAALLASIGAYGFSYLVRGIVAGAGWYGGYAIFLVADAIALLAIAAPLLVLASRELAAAAIVGAGLAGAVVPLLVGRRRLARSIRGADGTPFRVRSALTFAGPAGVIAVADQLLVNGGPLLVMVEGGTLETAGVVFAATMLVRVVVYLFQGIAASLLPNLTRLQAADLGRLGRTTAELVALMLAAGALIVAGAALIGPQVMTLLYGDDFAVGRAPLVLLGIGLGCYLAASSLSQALLAVDAGRRAAAAWALSGAGFVVLYAATDGDTLLRIASAFSVATFCALVLLGLAVAGVVRRARRPQRG